MAVEWAGGKKLDLTTLNKKKQRLVPKFFFLIYIFVESTPLHGRKKDLMQIRANKKSMVYMLCILTSERVLACMRWNGRKLSKTFKNSKKVPFSSCAREVHKRFTKKNEEKTLIFECF